MNWPQLLFAKKDPEAPPKPPAYEYDKKSHAYRDRATGYYVKNETILNLTESFIKDNVKVRLTDLTDKMLAGTITLEQWQEKAAVVVKQGYLVNSFIGKGGVQNMTQKDYGAIGGHLAFEYRHLNQFGQDIKNGTATGGQIEIRIGMYGDGTRKAYFEARERSIKENKTLTEERRILGQAEHCPDCLEYASRGWVPVGNTPAPGVACACKHNCKCDKEYR